MRFMAALSALFLACASASAGPVADAAARAEALQAEGKVAQALDALDEAVAAIWEASPLAFRKAALVDSAEGFGIYSERQGTTFKPDETITLYVEPIGFGYGRSGDRATIDLAADLAIENMTGQVISETKDAFTFSTRTRPNRRDFSLSLSFPAPYVRPGGYKAVVTLRDRNSEKSGTFEVPFTVTAP